MLLLKDKRNREEPYQKKIEQRSRVLFPAAKEEPSELDEAGSFRIFLDRHDQNIIAAHFSLTNEVTPDLIIKGKTAAQIYGQIIECGLVSKFEHAAYLGSELEKAEIGLRTGKEYIQDKMMFKE